MAFFNDLVRTIAAVEGMDEMTVRGMVSAFVMGLHLKRWTRTLSSEK